MQRTGTFVPPRIGGRPRAGMHVLAVVTVIATIAAMIALGANALGKIPDRDAIAAGQQSTRLLIMGGHWMDVATNPKRERVFHVLDAATGMKTGETLPLSLPEQTPVVTFSADGQRVAYTDTTAALGPYDTFVVEVTTGHVIRESMFADTFALQLNADGSHLALYRLSAGNRPPFTLVTVDIASGAILSTITLPESGGWPRVTPDLRTAYLLDTHTTGTWPNATSGTPTLEFVDLLTGAQRTVPLPMLRAGTFPQDRTVAGEPVPLDFSPALALSPDGARLYIVHADRDAITVVNVRDATMERTEYIAPNVSAATRLLGWLRPQRVAAKYMEGTSMQAAISPDGRLLAIIGQTITVSDDGQTYHIRDMGVRLVDLGIFTERAHILQREYQGYAYPLKVQWSMDGHHLYIGGTTDSTTPDGGRDAYQIRMMDARTHAITATQTYAADTETTRWMLENWFVLPG